MRKGRDEKDPDRRRLSKRKVERLLSRSPDCLAQGPRPASKLDKARKNQKQLHQERECQCDQQSFQISAQ